MSNLKKQFLRLQEQTDYLGVRIRRYDSHRTAVQVGNLVRVTANKRQRLKSYRESIQSRDRCFCKDCTEIKRLFGNAAKEWEKADLGKVGIVERLNTTGRYPTTVTILIPTKNGDTCRIGVGLEELDFFEGVY